MFLPIEPRLQNLPIHVHILPLDLNVDWLNLTNIRNMRILVIDNKSTKTTFIILYWHKQR